MRLRESLVLLLMIPPAYACENLVDPELDSRAVQFSPPAVYRTWWNIVQSCSGKSQSFDEVTWYEVRNSSTVKLKGKNVGAYWTSASNSIVLAGNGVLDGEFVRHEMLHAMLRQNGHPRSDFVERCGGAVACGAECIYDAGPGLDPNSVTQKVPPENLLISVSTQPQLPSRAVDGGYFTIVVSATNPHPFPVAITLPAAGEGFFFTMFGGTGGGIGGFESNLDNSRTVFAAGATKVKYFDVQIGFTTGLKTVLPGIYTIVGGYSRKQITVTGLKIGP